MTVSFKVKKEAQTLTETWTALSVALIASGMTGESLYAAKVAFFVGCEASFRLMSTLIDNDLTEEASNQVQQWLREVTKAKKDTRG